PPDDDALLAGFAQGAPPGRFDHAAHVRVAWLLVRRHGPAAAADRLTEGLRRLTANQGVPERYHETLTRAWAAIVAAAAAAAPELDRFDQLVARHPQLLDVALLQRHYAAATLAGDEARHRFVAADLRPLPTLGAWRGGPPST